MAVIVGVIYNAQPSQSVEG